MANYTLYNNDIPVASFVFAAGTIEAFSPIKPELLPMQIRHATADGFTTWLRDRSIDLNTYQHRQLMHGLLGSRDKVAIALSTHMFSISDTFTCFADGEFTPRLMLCSPSDQNEISNFILVSGDTTIRKARIATPNASTDGSFTKTWCYEDNAWWLYKLQSEDATRSEYEISCVLRECGWDAAEYDYDEANPNRIRTKYFVGKDEFFEPYDSLRFMFPDRSDDEEVIMENLASLGPDVLKAWKRILLADALFANTDRHTRNFGVIRSAVTGDILRLAPNFDNNQAYHANPGQRYTSAMLRMLMTGNEAEYMDDLRTLHEACKKHSYLSEATAAAARFL